MNSKKKYVWRKKKSLVCAFIIAILSINLTGCGGNSDEVIGKLKNFTELSVEDDVYSFYSTDGWDLRYTEENGAVRFENESVCNFVEESFDTECSNGGFSFDLDENEARIYLDAEINEGNLTIINYNLADDEYILMVDGKKYEASDEFINFVDSYDLAKVIKHDVENFKKTLENESVSFDDVASLNYDDIKNYSE